MEVGEVLAGNEACGGLIQNYPKLGGRDHLGDHGFGGIME